MKRMINGSLVFILLLGALAVSAQTDPAGGPDDDQGTLPPEKWDANEPAAIDWENSAGSALNDTFLVKKDPLLTSVEVVGLNTLIWFYDRYIREGGTNPGFRIGFNSWQENLTNGFEWDDNSFTTNQFAHPYHGSLYFNAARSNGYTFWESVPWTFGGSFLWEYFFEVHHPSMNDWIATSLGGVTLGEMLHRFSMSVLINPMGSFNRILDGDWGRIHANSPDRYPDNFRSQMDIGLRQVADEHLWQTDTTKVYMRFDFEYGDMFNGDLETAFDYFDFDLHLNFADVSLIGRADINGLLGGMFVKETDPSSHIVGAFTRFDYINNFNTEFGAQSLGAGFLSRYTTSSGIEIRTEVHTNVIVLGANKSDYRSTSGRSYDYGPGASVDLAAKIGRNGWYYLNLSHTQNWIHAINGNAADHYLTESVVRMDLPLAYNIGLGLEYRLLDSERNYRDYEDVSERLPELRLTTTWMLN
jgi:hypothetical protein